MEVVTEDVAMVVEMEMEETPLPVVGGEKDE
jgi:hypothetical protein